MPSPQEALAALFERWERLDDVSAGEALSSLDRGHSITLEAGEGQELTLKIVRIVKGTRDGQNIEVVFTCDEYPEHFWRLTGVFDSWGQDIWKLGASVKEVLPVVVAAIEYRDRPQE